MATFLCRLKQHNYSTRMLVFWKERQILLREKTSTEHHDMLRTPLACNSGDWNLVEVTQVVLQGQVENVGVQKWKYGNRSMEVRRKATYQCVFNALLTYFHFHMFPYFGFHTSAFSTCPLYSDIVWFVNKTLESQHTLKYQNNYKITTQYAGFKGMLLSTSEKLKLKSLLSRTKLLHVKIKLGTTVMTHPASCLSSVTIWNRTVVTEIQQDKQSVHAAFLQGCV